jgi:hypothetical protein
VCQLGQCVQAKTCGPGEYPCVSTDGTTQNCCAKDMVCYSDGKCYQSF